MKIFKTKQYLSSRNVRYWETGKNVGKGFVGITCPFCGDHAYSGNNHCGISAEQNRFSCFICTTNGTIVKLIKQLENCSWQDAQKIYNKYSSEADIKIDYGITHPINFHVQEQFEPLSKRHAKYLLGRGFDPYEIENSYHIKSAGLLGKYKLRIIIPFIVNGTIATFTSRTINDKISPKYEHCPQNKSRISPNHCVYNIDSIRKGDKIIICEGVTDVWKMGSGSVALLGKKISAQQMKMIINKQPSKIFVMLDQDAVNEAKKLASVLSIICPVENIELAGGDPGDLSLSDAAALKRELFN